MRDRSRSSYRSRRQVAGRLSPIPVAILGIALFAGGLVFGRLD